MKRKVPKRKSVNVVHVTKEPVDCYHINTSSPFKNGLTYENNQHTGTLIWRP